MAFNNVMTELNHHTMLTKKEVAKLLRCSVKTIERRVKLNLLKPFHDGGRVMFLPDENSIIKKALAN
jgi:hypothetical protein